MKRPKKYKKFSLDDIADNMDRIELGGRSVNDVNGIEEYIEELKEQTFDESEE